MRNKSGHVTNPGPAGGFALPWNVVIAKGRVPSLDSDVSDQGKKQDAQDEVHQLGEAAHESDQGDLGTFPDRKEALASCAEDGVASGGTDSGHGKDAAWLGVSIVDTTAGRIARAVGIAEKSDAKQVGGLAFFESAEFECFGKQRPSGAFADALALPEAGGSANGLR